MLDNWSGPCEQEVSETLCRSQHSKVKAGEALDSVKHATPHSDCLKGICVHDSVSRYNIAKKTGMKQIKRILPPGGSCSAFTLILDLRL